MNQIITYRDKITTIMDQVVECESANIKEAAQIMSTCSDAGKKIYFFGTGHSYIIGQEVFARAGGYAKFTPILLNELGMNHAFKSTLIERTKEYADVVLGLYTFQPGDVIIMTSNSGRNKLLIELALRLKDIGVTIIAMTALEQSRLSKSRHESGYRLFELADLILDIHSDYGDACITHQDDIKTGPSSTIIGCFLIQMVVTAFVEIELQKGKNVPVFVSSNIDQGDDHNHDLFAMNA